MCLPTVVKSDTMTPNLLVQRLHELQVKLERLMAEAADLHGEIDNVVKKPAADPPAGPEKRGAAQHAGGHDGH